MEGTHKGRVGPCFFRPADRSLQAYKEFILGITRALDPKAKDEWTEEQWQQAWEEFWTAAGSGTALP